MTMRLLMEIALVVASRGDAQVRASGGTGPSGDASRWRELIDAGRLRADGEWRDREENEYLMEGDWRGDGCLWIITLRVMTKMGVDPKKVRKRGGGARQGRERRGEVGDSGADN